MSSLAANLCHTGSRRRSCLWVVNSRDVPRVEAQPAQILIAPLTVPLKLSVSERRDCLGWNFCRSHDEPGPRPMARRAP